ncbi:MAG: PD-(D/E)XK nuclease family protein [Anaerolineae bacterium]|nr:PD-(D/E)XK nuclease family protein [Anaerolineae bacterium]
MPLPPDFHFSQSSLKDYFDCPRRFELRHLQKVKWPAPLSEPILEQERHIMLGEQFHHLLHQLFIGIPPDLLTSSLRSKELREWWDAFNRSGLLDTLPQNRHPEKMISASWERYRFLAKLDLLAGSPGQRWVIVDWKTSTHRPPSKLLKNDIQSRLYPFLLVQAGNSLNNGEPLLPDQVEMIYWFANFPGQIEEIHYSQEKYQKDREDFTKLAREISGIPAGRFLMTDDERKCRFCNYRSLCNRGDTAGDWRELEEEALEIGNGEGFHDIDFDQIGEIAF